MSINYRILTLPNETYMKKLITVILLLLTSCNQEEVSDPAVLIPAGFRCERVSSYSNHYCLNETYLFKESCDKEKQANFIIKCAEAANPKSDEEGEDLVAECAYRSAIFCTREYRNQPAAMLDK